ncbi:ATP12 family protein [Gluconobacter kondonii]|uniref:ATPase n=1 Tax=Gluconobacter kondonii TaxID=941463 RepID=A0ABQ5WNP3_9PROT|nr:ATP12 family protein [Gluconobacter kondonii]MBN3865988.1 ATP12 chaperone protein [Gluconobacter kondonii]MBS1052323.1 ATP12 chaperone protein [Gluconobacter kondonii]MBS1055577.1 ATP12 chaperone protein [Gluconobacter kondonii]MBS1064709.1 ATP12 chaperone protein [Gluconobacter kondonii]MBS1076324.1 ATP12 chaperone protein [Gluconobacter kondonii]
MSGHKRFWKVVSVVSEDGLFEPRLDGRPIRLPQGRVLAVRSSALADAIAGEWGGIAENASFTPDALPLTRIAGTMIERIAPDPQAARDMLLGLGVDDGLCYCEDGIGPVAKQVFAWLSGYGIHPSVTDGLMPVAQPDGYLAALTQLLAAQGDLELAVMGVLAQATGSLLLALAVVGGAVSLVDAVLWANNDEKSQLATWGQDDELVRTMENREKDILDAGLFLTLGRKVSI